MEDKGGDKKEFVEFRVTKAKTDDVSLKTVLRASNLFSVCVPTTKQTCLWKPNKPVCENQADLFVKTIQIEVGKVRSFLLAYRT